jgi:hypothetical protein
VVIGNVQTKMSVGIDVAPQFSPARAGRVNAESTANRDLFRCAGPVRAPARATKVAGATRF